MKFKFEIADRLRTVEVQQQDDGYLVTVDGRARLVGAVRVNEEFWSLIVRDTSDGEPRSVEAVIESQDGNGALEVHIDGYRIPVHLRNGRHRRNDDDRSTHGTGAQRIMSPMPGKVVRVQVRRGDEVKPRQVLVVVEAMKMENELRAMRGGRVVDVFVSDGQSVDAGAVLVVVE